MRAKFDPERQDACQAWIEEVTGLEMGDESFHEWLKSGVVLCRLVNKIKKKSVRKINKGKMAFKQRENISNYNNACKALGLRDGDCFVSQDLYEGDNLVAVIDQIYALGAKSRDTPGFEGPFFGVKFSTENKREFTKEQLDAAKKVVPLQNAGSIQVEKSKGTDKIVMYGKAGADLGKSVGGISQQNAGSIQVEKEKGTDHIVKYGKVGQELGESTGGVSQQNEGSLTTGKEKKLDSVSRALN